jgi:hypothetical protein
MKDTQIIMVLLFLRESNFSNKEIKLYKIQYHK